MGIACVRQAISASRGTRQREPTKRQRQATQNLTVRLRWGGGRHGAESDGATYKRKKDDAIHSRAVRGTRCAIDAPRGATDGDVGCVSRQPGGQSVAKSTGGTEE